MLLDPDLGLMHIKFGFSDPGSGDLDLSTGIILLSSVIHATITFSILNLHCGGSSLTITDVEDDYVYILTRVKPSHEC